MKDEKILSKEELMQISGGSNFIDKSKVLFPGVTTLYSIKPTKPIEIQPPVMTLYAIPPILEEK